jgi:hypothetical protein
MCLEPSWHSFLEYGAPQLAGGGKHPAASRKLFSQCLSIGQFCFKNIIGELFAGTAAAVEEDDGVRVLRLGLENMGGSELELVIDG